MGAVPVVVGVGVAGDIALTDSIWDSPSTLCDCCRCECCSFSHAQDQACFVRSFCVCVCYTDRDCNILRKLANIGSFLFTYPAGGEDISSTDCYLIVQVTDLVLQNSTT